MQVEQWEWRWGTQGGAFFVERPVPGLIGGQPGGAADVFLVVPDDLVLEQLIGRRIVGDAFISQQGKVERSAVRQKFCQKVVSR